MKFYYIYKALAHPENNGYVAPFTLQERLMHVAEADKRLDTRFTWICDSIENDLKHALGDRPNSEFVIDPDGRIVAARQWSKPDELRADLERLVGAVPRVTTIADLGMKAPEPPKTAPKGVVQRVQLPAGMQPVIVEPLTEETTQPFYAKLRVEVQQDYFRTGFGKMYLGFFLDPLYEVHWNNQAAQVRFVIESKGGLLVSRPEDMFPEVEVDADADPREFLMEVTDFASDPGQRGPEEFLITVKYFACDDAQTFCKAVTQQYRVLLQRDPDGGSRRAFGSRGARGEARPAGGPGSRMTPEERARMTPEQRARMMQQRRRQNP